MSDTGQSRSLLAEIGEFVLVIVAALAVALLVRTFVCEPFVIPSSSMEDTLQVGDRIIGEKLSYRGSSPSVGDIVTFIDPDDSSQTLIKRVIATEGQAVELIDGQVVVDGAALEESYTEGKPSEPIAAHASFLDEDISYPYVVPEGCIWVMGDNRTNSLDSRYFGAVSVSSVTSRACFRIWPLDSIGTL